MSPDVVWHAPSIVRVRWGSAVPNHRSWSPISTELLSARCDEGARRGVVVDDGTGIRALRNDGTAVLAAVGAATADRDGRWQLRLEMPDGWHYYGCGERTGLLERRGRRYTCWTTDRFESLGPDTDELYVAVPWLFAIDADGLCSGVFVDTTWRSWLDLTDLHGRTMEVGSDGPALDVVVFLGPSPREVLEQFTLVTGRMPMPPRWALGFLQSRWSYGSADEVREVVRQFRSRSLPLDGIGLDIDYMDRFRPFTWDRARFPEPHRLVSDLHGHGCRVFAVNDCALEADAPGVDEVRDEGVALDAFLRNVDGTEFTAYVWPGPCALPDFTRADVRQWWGGHHRFFTDAGVDGVVNDMNEPGLRDRPLDDPAAQRVEVPLGVRHGTDELATHAEVHNVYGLLHARACAEGLAALQPGRRHLVLSRAGFAGIQRYAGTWTGDTFSSWEHLEMCLPQLVNLGLSGIAFAGTDIGGFFGHCGPELLARWMQVGVVSPLMRGNNAQGCTPQEPWVWGDTIEASCRRSLQLRMRLLPYLYTQFAIAHRTGAPVLRPLWWAAPLDSRARSISDEAMLGDALLVAPVVRPGVEERSVYLPAGAWVDRGTGEEIQGPTTVTVGATLDTDLPMFLRGGHILPLGPVMQWSDERALDPLSLEVCPDERGRARGVLYEDDGRSHIDGGGAAWSAWFWRDGALHSRHGDDRRRVVVDVMGG